MAGGFRRSCFCDALGAGFAVLLVSAFPIVQITLGAVYVCECPVAPLIPVYVMVLGIWTLLTTAVFLLPKLLCPGSSRPAVWTLVFIGLLLIFFSWFLFGSFQIYSRYPPSFDRNSTDRNTSNSWSCTPAAPDSNQNLNRSRSLREMTQTLVLSNTNRTTTLSAPQQPHRVTSYCNRTIYMFAFWTNTLVYVLAGSTVLITICLYCFMKCTEIFVAHLST